MNMNFDLSLQQTQKLVMTQQLQMAIKILQLPSMELNEYIENELVDNPVLEANAPQNNLEEPKIDWTEVAKNYDPDDYEGRYQDDEENVSPLNFIASVSTLRDYLLFQLHFAINDKEDNAIGEYMIDNIDSAGYLRISAFDVAKHFNVDEKKVESIIKIIQTFEPLGVGARSIEECLLIQLSELGILNILLETVIKKYLNEIGENKYNIIAKELCITTKEAQAIGDIIKGLEPKPGRGFADSGDIKYITPDVAVEKISGHYVVMVNERTTPRLSISSYYRSILKSGGKDEATQEYIKRKLDSAIWLIKSIEQRRATIFNVVTSIVKNQQDFLDKGLGFLKPLTLKDIAEAIGVHESTVSRAINGKYVQTPRGLFQLKFFFTRGLDVAFGDNKSTESIKKIIKEIISNEDEKKPLSDQKITDILNKDGLNISRRTVAKYREDMGIPPTNKRKRF